VSEHIPGREEMRILVYCLDLTLKVSEDILKFLLYVSNTIDLIL
jgi:hypothetical protein